MTMNLNKTITHINNALFVAKMQNIIQYMYEDELEKAIADVFHQMREEILANLEEYYGDVLFNAHLDLILAPIHEHHKDYYNAIKKYKLREHRKGRVQGKRLINRAKQYAKQYSKNYYGGAIKADTLSMNSIIKKDELYATSEFGSQQMLDKTFVASEKTLARVDSDINQVITDGYQNGWGIKDVGNRIEKRFDQLETWEAKRIARTEIHGSHIQGVLNSFEDMDVEYLQWGAAHDSRVRDTHAALDGEIIAMGGVFSNGLRYPGDTSGPLSEFINCRCGVLPWFCPPGFMVPPGMSPFRESDLVATLDKWQTPDNLIESIQTQPVFDEAKFAKLKTNEEIAEFFGYEYIPKGRYYEAIDGKTFEFYDKENDVYLRFFREGNHKCKNIDFTNSGNAEYDLKEVLRIYDETHPNLKVGLDDINFKRWNSHGYSGDASGHTVNIYDLGLVKGEYETFTTVLDHELGHIFEDTFLIDNEFSNAVNVASALKPKIAKATKLDVELHKAKGINIHSLSDYATTNDAEEFAELISQSQSVRRGHNKKVMGERIKIPDETRPKGYRRSRDTPTIFENQQRNPNRFKLAEDLVEHPEKINPNWKSENQMRVKNSREHLNEFIKEEQTIVRAKKVKGYDKYALTKAEEKTLAELEAKESLGFKDRHVYEELANRKEFNKMWNKILSEGGDPHDYFAIEGAEGVKYERLYKQFKNWVPKAEIEIKPIKIKKDVFNNEDAFKLSTEEKEAYKQLKENLFTASDTERKYYKVLKDKVELNRYHNKLLGDGLDYHDSKNYLQLYGKYQKEWDLPELSYDLKFTAQQLDFELNSVEVPIGDKYALSKKELSEFDKLSKKKLFSDNSIKPKITKKELSRLESLEKQKEFNQLYYVRKGEGGLKYDDEQRYHELFIELKDKLNLSSDLIKPVPLQKYTPEIVGKNTRAIKLKGVTEDGHIPGRHTVDELFSVDVTKCTPRERKVIERWLGNDYAYFRDYLTRAERNIDDYVEFVLKADSEHLERYGYIKNLIEEGNLEEAANRIREIGLSVEHDLPILENILENNSIKKKMTLWRTEERLHIDGELEVGKKVVFKGYNSTAVTREGAEHFAEISHREFEWMYEIEAPAGTRGAYVAELNKREKFAKEMEFLLDKDTEMEIVEFDEVNKYVKFRIINNLPATKSNITDRLRWWLHV